MSRVVIATLFVLAACGAPRGASDPPAHEATPRTERPARSDVAAMPRPAPPAAPTAPEPPPTLAIRGEPRPGRVGIVVENRGEALVRLAPRIEIERETEGAWSILAGLGELTLRPDCEQDAPSCIELVPGAALHPPEWLAATGQAQCRCVRCTPAPAGTYRFVVQSCDGAHRIAGEPFEIDSLR